MLVFPFWLFCSNKCAFLTETTDFISVLREVLGKEAELRRICQLPRLPLPHSHGQVHAQLGFRSSFMQPWPRRRFSPGAGFLDGEISSQEALSAGG